MLFVAGARISIGGTPATGVFVEIGHTDPGHRPAKPAGTVHDIVVTLPGGLDWNAAQRLCFPLHRRGKRRIGTSIAKLSANEVTAGCGSGNYCPDSGATRAQMAVFLLRSKKGLCYATRLRRPGRCLQTCPADSFAAAWIEALAGLGVTSGCGGGNYCPNASVTRAQMSVFLLRMLEGSAYLPPPCTTPTFGDVPCSNPFAPWIEELVHRGITAGCGSGLYAAEQPRHTADRWRSLLSRDA